MAKCEDCGLEMNTATGCTVTTVTVGGKRYDRKPYEGPGRCHDCGALPMGVHHAGCDREECPACGEQLFICNCEKE